MQSIRIAKRVGRFVIVLIAYLVGFCSLLLLLGFLSRNYTRLGNSYKPVGRPLNGALDLNNPVPFVRIQHSNVLVGLSCSGGGSRAAYLTAAVLSEIQRRQEKLANGKAEPNPNMLAQINAISSVSGGSLAAAYFVLNQTNLISSRADSPAWQEYLEKMAVSYRRREWSPRALLPTVWFKLLFTNYHRGLMARDDYDRTLFHGAAMSDLPDQPALYLNSFDVANHVRFVFSKTYIDTTLYQQSGWWGDLSAPQDLTSENDLCFCRVDPSSVKIADAVYASSAFPVAYPNLALKHFGSKILFQGRLIFLADGGLADNSGLMTLLTQLKAAMEPGRKGALLLVIYIDATTDRIETSGSKFQKQGLEDSYAWHDTIIGHGIQSIDSGKALVQDLSWRFLENNGVVTDQINMNWPMELKAKSKVSCDTSKASFETSFASGELALRPCIIRLGLRDLANPNFQMSYSQFLDDKDPRVQGLLKANGIKEIGDDVPAPGLPERLQRIKTDFALSEADRHALDLAAYILVNGKLAGDLGQWNDVATTVVEKEKPNQ
jgi:predicted acylesterase/phospholipase RssA